MSDPPTNAILIDIKAPVLFLLLPIRIIAGVLMTANYMAEYNQDRFVLDIIAQEIAPPHRQAKAQVYVSCNLSQQH